MFDVHYNRSHTKLNVPIKGTLKFLDFSGCGCIRLKFHAKFAHLFKDKLKTIYLNQTIDYLNQTYPNLLN